MWFWLLPLLLLVALASFVAGVCAVLAWIVPRAERYLMFRPSRFVVKTPDDLGVPFDQVFIDTPDGCRLSAWHLRPDEPIGSVVYFDGNSGNLGILTEILALLYRNGLEVLAVDYRGYGWSTGSPTEDGLYVDGVTAVRHFRDHLRRPDLPDVPLVYWGRSLGSCVAARAASLEPPDGLVLESAFPSLDSMMRYFPRFRPFRLFSRLQLDTARHLRAAQRNAPVLFIHGDEDPVVPLEQGLALYEQAPGPKQFHCVDGADHINLHMVDTEGYLQRILRFVAELREGKRRGRGGEAPGSGPDVRGAEQDGQRTADTAGDRGDVPLSPSIDDADSSVVH